MAETEALKQEIKKIRAKATELKMNLHDLSEELPQGWEQIMTVAKATYDAHAALTEARARLQDLERAAA